MSCALPIVTHTIRGPRSLSAACLSPFHHFFPTIPACPSCTSCPLKTPCAPQNWVRTQLSRAECWKPGSGGRGCSSAQPLTCGLPCVSAGNDLQPSRALRAHTRSQGPKCPCTGDRRGGQVGDGDWDAGGTWREPCPSDRAPNLHLFWNILLHLELSCARLVTTLPVLAQKPKV